MFIRAVLHVIDDSQPRGRCEDVNVQTEVLQPFLAVNTLGPHVRIDNQVASPSRPAFFLHRRAGRGFQMDAQHIKSALVHRFGHTLKVSAGLCLRCEMAETVDHVERGVELLLHFEVRHIPHDDGLREIVLFKPFVAEFDSFRVEIVTCDVKT